MWNFLLSMPANVCDMTNRQQHATCLSRQGRNTLAALPTCTAVKLSSNSEVSSKPLRILTVTGTQLPTACTKADTTWCSCCGSLSRLQCGIRATWQQGWFTAKYLQAATTKRAASTAVTVLLQLVRRRADKQVCFSGEHHLVTHKAHRKHLIAIGQHACSCLQSTSIQLEHN